MHRLFSGKHAALILSAAAAFSTYFCMYAFRKPFTAGTYEGQMVFGQGMKAMLVLCQLIGYLTAKFLGVKVVSELRDKGCAKAIVLLILFAQLTLVGFAYLPSQVKIVMLFLNGLSLGMIFGLVMVYLEGRQETEALSAVLCASFIMSSGVVKSVGKTLIDDYQIPEFEMPMVTGLIFLPFTFISVWLLSKTPEPSAADQAIRQKREAMDGQQRRVFLGAYWPGLGMMLFVFMALTILRTLRDDFGVELWRDMGTDEPTIFAQTETLVAICVTTFSAFAIWIKHNITALKMTVWLMCAAFVGVIVSVYLQRAQMISGFTFMVACGVGLYVPYVAFHTTVFERIIAASKHPANLGFLMCLADALGYLAYAILMMFQSEIDTSEPMLGFFQGSLVWVCACGIFAMLLGMFYFQRRWQPTDGDVASDDADTSQTNLEEIVGT